MTQIDACIQAIQQADGLLITAGAGFGVDSGLPDFRGTSGFWKAYPALGRQRIDFASIASPAAFQANARLAWGFYGHRLALYRRTIPHAGFGILQRIGERLPLGSFVCTSNVDGQFQKAGFPADRVAELHGSIHHLQCISGCHDDIWSAETFEPTVDAEDCLLTSTFPICRHCGALARPNILMFGDWQWRDQRTAAQQALLGAWLGQIEHLLVIEVGAGTSIPTLRKMGDAINGTLIRINPREAEVRRAGDISIPLGALDALRLIENAL